MLKFTQITDIKDKNFKSALDIYINSFPENQRLSLDVIRTKIQENLLQFIVGLLEEKIVLMAILYPLNNSNFVLLAYLATDEAFQNQGIGKKFFSYILNALTLSQQYLIIEVENPDIGNEQENKRRRINFYRKFGAKEMQSLRYILPPLSEGTSTEMKLMILPEYRESAMSGSLVKKLIKQIYQEVYSLDENDYFLNSFIHDIEHSVALL